MKSSHMKDIGRFCINRHQKSKIQVIEVQLLISDLIYREETRVKVSNTSANKAEFASGFGCEIDPAFPHTTP